MMDIYMLVHVSGFTPEYIESICPADRAVFMYFAKMEQKQKDDAESQQ